MLLQHSRTFFLLLLLTFCYTVVAQGKGKEKSSPSRVELVTNWDGKSSAFFLGVRFVMKPGWYIYWKNPGESGLPPDIQLELPPYLEADSVLFPVPQKIVHSNIVSYGYYDSVMLLIPIRITDPKMLQYGDEIRARISWLVCEKSCLVQNATIRYSLGIAQAKEEQAIRQSLDKLPRSFHSATLTVDSVKIQNGENGIHVLIRFAKSGMEDIQDFYPGIIPGFYTQVQLVDPQNNEIQIALYPEEQNAALHCIEGLLVTNKNVYEFVYKQ